jgi:hypothetical protein
VVSTVEHIRFTLMSWLKGVLLKQCLGWQLQISGIVRHHWKEIEKSETLAKLFPEPPVVAFRSK